MVKTKCYPRIIAIMMVVIMGGIFTLLVWAEMERDEKYGGIWTDSPDPKIISELYPEGASRPQTDPSFLRKEAKKEINDLRDKIEDELRVYLLATYWDKQKIDKVKKILNKQWDKEGIEFLWNDIDKSGFYFNKRMLVNLLVYVASKYENTEVVNLIKDKLNILALEMQEQIDNNRISKGEITVLNALWDAISEYGSLKVIFPAIWKVAEKSKDRNINGVLKIFESHPSEEGIKQLQDFTKTVLWREDDERRKYIGETIQWIKELLRYPVIRILAKYHNDYAKSVVKEANAIKGADQDRIKFLEQKIEEYANSRIAVANNPDTPAATKQKELKEAEEIKAKLKEYKEKKKTKPEFQESPEKKPEEKPKK